MLARVDIHTREDLERVGPVRAFARLKQETDLKPSLNLLYAMVAALDGRHWTEVNASEKAQLLMELEGYQTLAEQLRADDPNRSL